MLKLNGNQLTYAQFQAVLADIGPVAHMFYRDASGNVNSVEGDFVDRHYSFGVSLDPAVSVATLTTDYPFAIDANVSVSV